MSFPRATGILLHPTSLPSRGGIGDFGPAAYNFLNFLSSAKQSLWQVLPLGPPAGGNSPYSSTSAFAGNPLLISLERLAERGWLDRYHLSNLPEATDVVDYDWAQRVKPPLLSTAANSFLDTASGVPRVRFERFCADNGWWLEDYVLFDALRNRYEGQSWAQWPAGLARRESQSLENARNELAHEIAIARVIQFFFWEQWRALRVACAERSLRVVGDVAIFVDYESADVWAHPEHYRLKDDLSPEVVSGVPPDAYSADGQRWGNPLYDWRVLREQGYEWWIQRLRWATNTCDYIRLDHFRGFAQFWEIPAHEPTAIHGHWVDGPGEDLFRALREALGSLPFFAEDLGVITPDVVALRERLGVPGMAVLQFGFGDVGAHVYLPHRLVPNRVVYTGTHDNDTILGWWQALGERERAAVESLVGRSDDGVNWALIRAAQGSVAELSVIPMQDVLSLGSESRLNIPSKPEGNYRWRMRQGAFTQELVQRLAALAEITDRSPEPVAIPPYEEFAA